jgi:hypothetical protein
MIDMLRLLIAPIAIGIIYAVIFSIAQKEARKAEKVMDANDFIIRQPKASLKVYIFVTVFFFVLYILSLLGLLDSGIDELKERWWVFLLAMSPFLVFGPFLTVFWYRWKIAVKGNQLTVSTFFGKKKTFTFDYITKVKYSSISRLAKTGQINTEYIYAYHEKKKLFTVTSVCAGFQILASRLKDAGITLEWQ